MLTRLTRFFPNGHINEISCFSKFPAIFECKTREQEVFFSDFQFSKFPAMPKWNKKKGFRFSKTLGKLIDYFFYHHFSLLNPNFPKNIIWYFQHLEAFPFILLLPALSFLIKCSTNCWRTFSLKKKLYCFSI